jgi:predicted  nucleic acid-binding Zn-ribbon protein
MHEQVMVLGTLWRLDQDRDGLIAEARDLADKVRKADQQIEDSRTMIAQLKAQSAELTAQEKTHSRRMEAYIRRRDSTQRALDEGRISDFLVAEKQVTDCGAIVEQEEDAVLELMEQQDAVGESLTNAQSGLGLRRVQRGTARGKEVDRRPDLEAELGTLTVKRDEARSQVRGEVLLVYDQRRRKGLRVMAPLENKGCSGCKVSLPAIRFSDIRRSVDIFQCDNCGCFLAPGQEELPE